MLTNVAGRSVVGRAGQSEIGGRVYPTDAAPRRELTLKNIWSAAQLTHTSTAIARTFA